MKYISEDGKVFDTEQECLEHEKEIEAEKVRKEKLEEERQSRLNTIYEKYEELNTLISDYNKDYTYDSHIHSRKLFDDVMDMMKHIDM